MKMLCYIDNNSLIVRATIMVDTSKKALFLRTGKQEKIKKKKFARQINVKEVAVIKGH